MNGARVMNGFQRKIPSRFVDVIRGEPVLLLLLQVLVLDSRNRYTTQALISSRKWGKVDHVQLRWNDFFAKVERL